MSKPAALTSDPCPARDSTPGASHSPDRAGICAFCSTRVFDFIVALPAPPPPPELAPGSPAPTVTVWRDKPPTLADAQRIVGGYVQRVPLVSPQRVLLVDEDGLLKHLPRNPEASMIAGTTIVGPALILEGKARKGWNS